MFPRLVTLLAFIGCYDLKIRPLGMILFGHVFVDLVQFFVALVKEKEKFHLGVGEIFLG